MQNKVLRQQVVSMAGQMDCIPKDVLIRVGADKVGITLGQTGKEVCGSIAGRCDGTDCEPLSSRVCNQIGEECVDVIDG